MNLSLKGNKVYKGEETHNGTLLKVHDNSFTIGYSDLLTPDGKNKASIRFGNGAFYDIARQDNVIFSGKPTYAGAYPHFAGIVCRQQDIASGYPVHNDKVTSYNKGLLVKEGFITYKRAYFVGGDKDGVSLPVSLSAFVGFYLKVHKANGSIGFATKNENNDVWTVVGRIIAYNPDDASITVHVSSVYTAQFDVEPATNPTLSVVSSDNHSITIKGEATKVFTLSYSYMKSTESKYTRDFVGELAHYNAGSSKFVSTITIPHLEKNTEYKVFAIGRGVGGYAEQELTKSTTNI